LSFEGQADGQAILILFVRLIGLHTDWQRHAIDANPRPFGSCRVTALPGVGAIETKALQLASREAVVVDKRDDVIGAGRELVATGLETCGAPRLAANLLPGKPPPQARGVQTTQPALSDYYVRISFRDHRSLTRLVLARVHRVD
jgi:hypothetical protein